MPIVSTAQFDFGRMALALLSFKLPMIELYLIRHGVAEERGEAWPDDAKRPLTQEGMAKLRRAARALERLDVALDVIVTSPLVRTRQTAEIIAGGHDPRAHIVVAESLAPGGSFAAVMADLEKQAKRSRLAIVGHEPGIGEMAARLIGTRHPIPFKKGAIARIDVEGLPDGPGDLRWFMTPKILRSIRK
jgi:phosphohistidine phosphatase